MSIFLYYVTYIVTYFHTFNLSEFWKYVFLRGIYMVLHARIIKQNVFLGVI